MRAHKPKNIDQKLERCSSHIAEDPSSLRGHWAESRGMPGAEIRLDIGCGKGNFLKDTALAEPDALFVGLDVEDICVLMSARHAKEAGVDNAVFFIGRAEDLPQIFAPGELSTIYLNFCTPMPPAKCADRRLTYAERLVEYRSLLDKGGRVLMKTDSQPFFDWSLGQFELAGYRIEWKTDDAHRDGLAGALTDVEAKLLSKGAKVSALEAVPEGDVPPAREQTGPMSLVDFLPEDLENMDYVPYGMEDTVTNIVNRRKNEAEKAARHAARGEGNSTQGSTIPGDGCGDRVRDV